MPSHHLEEFLRSAEKNPVLLRELERVENAEHLCSLARAAGFRVVPTDVALLRRARRRAAQEGRTAREPQPNTAVASVSAF